MTNESDSGTNSLLDEINITRVVAISFALSVLLTAGTGLAMAADDKQTIDSNDSLFCKKTDTGTSASYDEDRWAYNETVQSQTGWQSSYPTKTNLGSITETFVQFTFGAGLIGAFVVWQGTAIGNMLSMDRKQKRSLKKYRGSATKSFGILVLIGPMFTVVTSVLGVGAVGCISLTFF